MKACVKEAGVNPSAFSLVWSVNPTILRLPQNPKREWSRPKCECNNFPGEYCVNGHVTTTAGKILKNIRCSLKMISVICNYGKWYDGGDCARGGKGNEESVRGDPGPEA